MRVHVCAESMESSTHKVVSPVSRGCLTFPFQSGRLFSLLLVCLLRLGRGAGVARVAGMSVLASFPLVEETHPVLPVLPSLACCSLGGFQMRHVSRTGGLLVVLTCPLFSTQGGVAFCHTLFRIHGGHTCLSPLRFVNALCSIDRFSDAEPSLHSKRRSRVVLVWDLSNTPRPGSGSDSGLGPSVLPGASSGFGIGGMLASWDELESVPPLQVWGKF